VKIIITEKSAGLFIAYTGIDQDQPIPVLDKQASHCPGAKVILIRRVQPVPDRFRNHAEHGAAVKFEHTSMYDVEIHC